MLQQCLLDLFSCFRISLHPEAHCGGGSCREIESRKLCVIKRMIVKPSKNSDIDRASSPRLFDDNL